MSETLTVGRIATIQGQLRPPSDKSLTHRAYILGSIAAGVSKVHGPLRAADCDATLRCLSQMGLHVEESEDGFELHPSDWRSPQTELDCGNSGTTMRLLAGLVASRDIEAVLNGDESLSRRPMGRIAEPLRMMGARIDGDHPPLRIKGAHLEGIRYSSPVASAQVKSCLLLAGLRAKGETWISEPAKSRDHTERMLAAAGVQVQLDDGQVGVQGGAVVQPFEFSVPGDISSAAFFMVAAAILPDGDVQLNDVGLNPTRTGVLDVLAEAGVGIQVFPRASALGEPVGDVHVWRQDVPRSFEIGGSLVPRLIDEIPALAVLASQCDGVTTIRDASELAVKESDRIAAICDNLAAMGVKVEPTHDGMKVWGPARLKGTQVDARGDHRIAMAFAIAGLIAEGPTTIRGAHNISTSFPDFENALWRLAVV